MRLVLICLLFCNWARAQDVPAYEAKVLGGKDELEQVLQTQLTLPEVLLPKGFSQRITAVFDIDSANSAVNISFEGKNMLNNIMRLEMVRTLTFLKFEKMSTPGYLDFTVSTDKYYHYRKQKDKPLSIGGIIADSSMTVYTRTDKSPEYFKNGDAGMRDFIDEELSYPGMAKQNNIQGTVQLEFVVETNGYVTNLRVLKSVNGGCTEEAIRIIKKTRWIPATQNGMRVRYRMKLPIAFNLQSHGGVRSAAADQ
jgi:TonB family protein